VWSWQVGPKSCIFARSLSNARNQPLLVFGRCFGALFSGLIAFANITSIHRRCQELFLEGIYTFWGGPSCPPPPPKPPFRCPHPDKKGTNLLLFQAGIYLHTHQDLKLKCCRVMGQKLRYGRPCTRDLPGTHNWLAQSHIASISSEFH